MIRFLVLLVILDVPGNAFAGPTASPNPGEVFRDCSDCPEMTAVPAGEFDMGSKDTLFQVPLHRVTIAKPFAIGRREISFAEWDACVSEGKCKHRPNDHGWGRDEQPVVDVSWLDAKEFALWLTQRTSRNYRLPSEAEWEYAARAGTSTTFWWGPEAGKTNANCSNCADLPRRRAMRTGSFLPNGFGLYDTAGNVYEWVEDCWNDSYFGAPKEGFAWTSGDCRQRVIRGGSFASKSDAITSAARFRYDLDVRYIGNGFRVVRDLP